MIYKGMVCQWCGATFTAQKSSTRYCSKRCANLANKQKIREMTQGIVESQNMEKLRLINKEREVMSPKALAEYLGSVNQPLTTILTEGSFQCFSLLAKLL